MFSAQTMQNEEVKIIKGYKATDANLQCRGFQFAIGEWYEVEGELVECENGFHFCEQPSGPWAYYSAPGTRIWKIEAQDVLETKWHPGADRKCVARKIRLVEEIIPDGNCNTGDWNTGDWNTGNWNTGDWNTGNWNTGDWNTGNWNTGNCNTGNCNTGNCNTGNWNTGDWNTGNCNTGNCNTGDWNATDRCSGFFCAEQQTVPCFDGDTGLTYEQFRLKHGSVADSLSWALTRDDEIKYEGYATLPNITPEKLKALHEKHKEGRAKA